MRHRIGVFDSGVGGLTTLAEIKKLLPDEEYFYVGDHENNPYGEKSPEELTEITTEVVRQLRRRGVEMVVIACNTATTKCIDNLRRRFPEIRFVGTEPAIKVACDRDYQKILLLATPNTASSKQVQNLINNYVKDKDFTVIPCYGLARAIEDTLTPVVGRLDAARLNMGIDGMEALNFDRMDITHSPKTLQDTASAWQKLSGLTEIDRSAGVSNTLEQLLEQADDPEEYDAVILGCTHYIYLRDQVRQYFPQATMIDGNNGVARRVKYLIDNMSGLSNIQ